MSDDPRDHPSYLITFGPISHLRVGCVWTLDIGKFGLVGIGWSVRWRWIA